MRSVVSTSPTAVRRTLFAVATPLAVAALLAALACGDDDLTVAVDPGAGAIFAAAGSGQQAPVGAELPDPVVVRIEDQAGAPLSARRVAFLLPAGAGGDVDPDTAVTDAEGIASARWRLGRSVGEQRLTAQVVTSGPSAGALTADFVATALGPPAQLVFTTLPKRIAQSGVDLPKHPRLAVVDGGGTLVATPGTLVTVSADGVSLTGTLVRATDDRGIARFSDLVPHGPAGLFTLTFSSPGLASITSETILLSAGATPPPP